MKFFSKSLIKSWKKILKELYNYKTSNDFFIVPAISQKKSFVYLPLLNYTDLKSVQDLKLPLENYQIRLLNFGYQDFKENDPVTMRLDLVDNVFETLITSKCRNQIRKAEKSDIDIFVGENEFLDEFYLCFRDTMNRYGTPVFDKRLFSLILKNLNSNIILAKKDGKTVAGLIVIFDKEIAFVPWAGSDPNYSKFCPNHGIYWRAIELSIEKNKKIFDFGRSPYGGATHSFKKQWGAKPVKIDIITDKEQDLYSKYSLASKIYKKLPNFLTNFIGPKLCKYLPDL